MTNDLELIQILKQVSKDFPANAVSLRRYSAKIISEWIKSGRSYPHNMIDGFVYIESSIEQTLVENLHDPVALDVAIMESYQFHKKSFSDLVVALLDYL